jgi:hypothetical protein
MSTKEDRACPISNPVELRTYAEEHVAYEVQMFLEAATTGLPADASWFRKMQGIETFVLHLRNLAYFLHPHHFTPRGSDIVATDFLPQANRAQWEQSIAPSEDLKDAKRRADKELAHLTTSRISGMPPSKSWSTFDLAREINSNLTTFLSLADERLIGPVLRSAISQGATSLSLATPPERCPSTGQSSGLGDEL